MSPLFSRMSPLFSHLASYPWSSYLVHGLGKALGLIDEAPVWGRLGKTEAARQSRWRKWVHTPLTEKELTAVRRAVTTGRPYGTERWVAAMARRLDLDLAPRPRGRPRKQPEK